MTLTLEPEERDLLMFALGVFTAKCREGNPTADVSRVLALASKIAGHGATLTAPEGCLSGATLESHAGYACCRTCLLFPYQGTPMSAPKS